MDFEELNARMSYFEKMLLKNATFFLLLMAEVAVFALFGAFFAEK